MNQVTERGGNCVAGYAEEGVCNKRSLRNPFKSAEYTQVYA